MSSLEPTPINPGSSPAHDRGAAFVQEVLALSPIVRLILAAVLSLIAYGCITGGLGLTEYGHWVPWAFTLLFLEPIALACILAIPFLLVPRSALGRWLSRALMRVSVGVALVVIALGSAALWVILSGLWELYSLSR